MDKSPDAFRTISEVAEQLETPAHVLRFWESRFPQIKPVKRAGGRRYYRPADVALLSGIRHLLHDEGMTIRGVQKILREQGVRHVAALAEGGDALVFDVDADDLGFVEVEDAVMAEEPAERIEPVPAPSVAPSVAPAFAQVFALDLAMRPPGAPLPIKAEIVPLRAVPDQKGNPVVQKTALPPAGQPEGPVLPSVPVEDAPEAGHIWVVDEPELALGAPAPLLAVPVSEPAGRFMELAPPDLPSKLSGFAARLRDLTHPLAAENGAKLAELHSRLGLLHAQIAEALRLRR